MFMHRPYQPPGYATWGILENKTNASSHSNISSLKTAIEEELKNIGKIYFKGMQIVSKACYYNA